MSRGAPVAFRGPAAAAGQLAAQGQARQGGLLRAQGEGPLRGQVQGRHRAARCGVPEAGRRGLRGGGRRRGGLRGLLQAEPAGEEQAGVQRDRRPALGHLRAGLHEARPARLGAQDPGGRGHLQGREEVQHLRHRPPAGAAARRRLRRQAPADLRGAPRGPRRVRRLRGGRGGHVGQGRRGPGHRAPVPRYGTRAGRLLAARLQREEGHEGR
mmetsp:Transcript_1001/g.3086  ORF Transcript_1001/g.3086 Transcript_1001/m.3086 type:complete len:212 (+) Transcript_1001:1748-2383(+)